VTNLDQFNLDENMEPDPPVFKDDEGEQQTLDQSAEHLIERARATNSAQVRVDLLENFYDLILNKEPALLVDQFPSLLSFWPVSNDATKQWLLECAENACLASAELLAKSLPMMLQAVEAPSTAEVQQRAIRTVTRLYPNILYQMYAAKEFVLSLFLHCLLFLFHLSFVPLVIHGFYFYLVYSILYFPDALRFSRVARTPPSCLPHSTRPGTASARSISESSL
jgi:hypothetical protein